MGRSPSLFAATILGLVQFTSVACATDRAVVTVPTANLRNQPVEGTPGDYTIDKAQETQVLLGDELIVTGERGEWLEVQVPSQKTYDKEGHIIPYPGLIQKRFVQRVESVPPPNLAVVSPTANLLSEPAKSGATAELAFQGTYLLAESTNAQNGYYTIKHPTGRTLYIAEGDVRPQPSEAAVSRSQLIANASLFLGATYYWGGYTFPRQQSYPEVSTGVDCSGLMGVTYRQQGVELPRNAKDIFRWGARIPLAELKKGDFVFISKTSDPMRIYHVMMYDEGERFIESTNADSSVVRFSTFTGLFGMDRKALDSRNGQASETRWVMAAKLPQINYAD